MENLNYNQAMSYAVRLLSFRMRTAQEIAERLAKKDFEQETIAAVIRRLQELGYINDHNYVESYIRSKIKPTGSRRLQYELINKGVAKDIIDNQLAINYTPEQELAAARALAEKLWRQEEKRVQSNVSNMQENELKQKTSQKIAQKILNRGFSYSTVSQIMRQIAPDTLKND
ncbi:MAG TPA: regulatory protein RecX [Candidatus Deferrimicrobium sp.]|nr:regulatory protein RecX [Candidatus Deferrimicrobium sp.]